MHILALCGSLRSASSNLTVLQCLGHLVPDGVTVELFDGIGALPLFNPDLDAEPLPEAVSALRQAIGTADALVISSPEYAHGMAGAMKNALDWLVSSLEFPAIHIALINTAQRARHSDAQLREVLTTMSARLVKEASITLPLSGRAVTALGILSDPVLADPLAAALRALVAQFRADGVRLREF
jgi:NAD(P)H-dependent FMN reductase